MILARTADGVSDFNRAVDLFLPGLRSLFDLTCADRACSPK